MHYLDNASVGRPSPRTVAAVQKAAERLAQVESTGTAATLELFQAVEEARRQAARFVNVDPANVVLVGSTTQGLGLLASSLPLSRGDNILMDDLEFMGAPVAWRSAARRWEIEIRPVKTEGGRVRTEDFCRHAGAKTRALVLSSVQEVSGYRVKLDEFQALARRLNAFLIVDGIQEVGAVPVDLSSGAADAYCAGGHKWMRSPYGLGFLYISPRLLERLQPPFYGYLALAEPPEGWDAYMQSPERTPFDPLRELADARRLEPGGMPNWVGAVALREALAEAQEMGRERIWERISDLTCRLKERLKPLGLTIVGESDAREHQSGIVCFSMPGGLAQELALLERLLQAHVYVSVRYVSGVGGIRVSPHYVNTPEDVDRLIAVTSEFLGCGAGA